jgi:hypothetical protein
LFLSVIGTGLYNYKNFSGANKEKLGMLLDAFKHNEKKRH